MIANGWIELAGQTNDWISPFALGSSTRTATFTNTRAGWTVGENLYSNHGRGIFLINQLMDEVKFRKNGTEIHMVKR